MAGRDATVARGADAPQALVRVRAPARALEVVDLSPARRDAAPRGLRRAEPGERHAAGHLEHLTKLLSDAGAPATTGAALADPPGAVAGALGPVGAAILRALE